MRKYKFGRVKYVLLAGCLLSFGAAIIIYPQRYISRCFEGFALWAECVLPSLFPFMIIALALVKSGVAEKMSLPLRRVTGIFNLPENAAVCFVLSIFSGYPAGSKIIREFYDGGALDSESCRLLAPLCSTSGPLFIIGSVGYKMFGDGRAGLKIFAAHVIAVVTISLIFAVLSKRRGRGTKKRLVPSKNALYDTFYGAVISVAVAGGFIAFFYTYVQFLDDFNIFLPIIKIFTPLFGGECAGALCAGLAEATTGCSMLAATDSFFKAPLAGFMITFGGASILMQQLSHLSGTGVSAIKFILMKLLQGAACFGILCLFCLVM